MNLKLIIGNQNYSSWSLRPWLLMTAFDVHFAIEKVSLRADGLRERLLSYSPTARVPVLLERDTAVWDSLAICEYLNDVYLDGQGWPHGARERGHARALTCEVHAGFSALRGQLPMNIRARRRVPMTPSLQQDLTRLDEIWSDHHRSGWLFESFGIADCFYAPVALRLQTYGIVLSEPAMAYQQRLLAHPALQLWCEQAALEDEILPEDEAGEPA